MSKKCEKDQRERASDLKSGEENRRLGKEKRKEINEVWRKGWVEVLADRPVYVLLHSSLSVFWSILSVVSTIGCCCK